jgi:hypothetical protein
LGVIDEVQPLEAQEAGVIPEPFVYVGRELVKVRVLPPLTEHS